MSLMSLKKQVEFLREMLPDRRLARIEAMLKDEIGARMCTNYNCVPNAELRVEICLAEHCNLSCCGCDHFSPLAKPKLADFETVERDMERLSRLFDGSAGEICLVGGEPLLHPEIIRFMEMCRDKFPDSLIYVITNGVKLGSEPEEFWTACRENRIVLRPTRYPINVDYDKIMDLAKQHHVTCEFFGMTGKALKLMRHIALHPRGDLVDTRSFMNCRLANHCLTLEDGRIYTCPIPAKIHIFNEYFGTDMKVSPRDSIDIYQAESAEEILQFAAHPVPFCKYCRPDRIVRNIPWHASKKDIKEWVLPD